MALSDEQKARLFPSALGIVRQQIINTQERGIEEFGINPSNTARRIYEQNRTVPGMNYQSALGIANAAIRADRLARFLNEIGDAPNTVAGIPIVPSNYPEEERFRYEVVITIEDSAGKRTSIGGTVRSDTPLTGDEVRAHAEEGVETTVSPTRGAGEAWLQIGRGSSIVGVSIQAVYRIR